MANLADIAIQHQCGCFEWKVLDWNQTAMGFYERLRANVLAGRVAVGVTPHGSHRSGRAR